ncbi:GTPase [Streptomyces sp. NPDC088789]|uniref:GTPase n=1 Tax=Streptomyces sp. NPDC088789 TaxID=3365899 RepID=UPI00382141C5
MTAVTDQDHTDHADPGKHTAPAGDDAEHAVPADSTQPSDSAERADDPPAADSTDSTERTERTEGTDGTEGTDRAEPERSGPERSDPAEKPLPTESANGTRTTKTPKAAKTTKAAKSDTGDAKGGGAEPREERRAEPRRASRDEPRTGSRPRPRSGEAPRTTETPRTKAPTAPPAAPPRPKKPPKAAGARVEASDGLVWDDGLIARRVNEDEGVPPAPVMAEPRGARPLPVTPLAFDGPLRSRLDALRELVGLSRTRLDSRTLAEAGRVLDEASARRRLSGQHTVIALAGATGSGKSRLFNALAGVTISETGVRRPTTSSPIACSWSDGAAGLIDRLGIPGRLRRRPGHNPEAEAQLRGLVLIDLPDVDSAAVEHREQAERVLALVDAVVWVVDPEKYADAVLHERYLRPMAGHAEVMFIVLNQIDRLPGEATEQVLDDLRRLLDEDGIALGEYGEPGANVLAISALTGDGLGDLREALGQFLAERGAAARRISADMDAAAARLRPVYATGRRSGLSEEARDEFSARLADAVGATAAGEAAERAWLRNANRACGTPWLRLWRWYQDRGEPATGRLPLRSPGDEEATARQRVEQAVRTVSDRASAGLPTPWATAVREAATRGSQGLPEALDELATRAGLPPGRPPRPGWWPVAVLAQAAMTLLQIVGGLWLVGQITGMMAPNLGVPVLLMVAGIVGGPLVEWSCRLAARGPARRYGLEAERRLRDAAAGCGRARVLDPVAAELLRYREVREQYGRVVGVGIGGR